MLFVRSGVSPHTRGHLAGLRGLGPVILEWFCPIVADSFAAH